MKPANASTGYAYIEVLIAVLLVATSLTPMMDSFSQLVSVQTRQAELAELQTQAQGLMEAVASTNYTDLDSQALAVGSPSVPTSHSDPAAQPNRRLVFLSRYDIDNEDSDKNQGATVI